MLKGEKLVCIADNNYNFTIGNIYSTNEDIDASGSWYNIYDLEKGFITSILEWEYHKIFITLSKYREERIKEILNV